MDIFDLVATLSLDTSEYEEDLQGAESSASSVGGKILGGLGKVGAGVGAVVGAVGAGVSAVSGALVSGTKDLASYGDEIDKESQKLHMSAEGYQEWSAILEHSGSSISGLKMGMKTLTNELDKGLKSTEEARKAYDELAISYSNGEISIEEFEKANAELEESVHDSLGAFGELGFSLNDVAKLAENPEDAFGQIITKLQEMDDETTRTAIANDLLGRSAVELAPLLNTSAEETEQMRQRVHELGGVLSDEAVKASAGFQDQLQDMQTAQQSLSRNLLSNFLPSITKVMGGLTDIFAGDTSLGGEKIAVGIDNLVTRMLDEVPKFANVGLDIVFAIADSILNNSDKIFSSAISMLEKLISKFSEKLPDIVKIGANLVTSIIKGISDSAPVLIPAVLNAVIDAVNSLIDNLPTILDAILNLVTTLVNSLLNDGIPILLQKLPEMIIAVIDFIISSIPKILQAVISIVLAIVSALPDIIKSLISAIPDIITSVIVAILSNLPLFIDAGIQLFVGLIGALPEIIIALVGAIPQIITGLVNGFKKSAPQIKESGKKLLVSLGDGLKNLGNTIKNAVTTIWNAIKSNLTDKITNVREIGANILQGLVDGLKSKISAVTEVISNVASKISDGFKDFFGIASPSKLFKEYGKFIDEGFAIGVEDNADTIEKAMDKTFDFSDQIVNVQSKNKNDIMGARGNEKKLNAIIELLNKISGMDIVRLDPNEKSIYSIVRRQNYEYFQRNGTDGLIVG